MLSLCSFYRKSVWSWRLEAHGVFCQQHNFIRNWNPLELGHQREFQSRSDPVHMDGRATRGMVSTKELQGNSQAISKSAPLLPSPESLWNSFSFNPDVIKKKCVLHCATSLEALLASLLVITILTAWGQRRSHSPLLSSRRGWAPLYPCILSPPSLKTLLWGRNSYSFGATIALRKLLADNVQYLGSVNRILRPGQTKKATIQEC